MLSIISRYSYNLTLLILGYGILILIFKGFLKISRELDFLQEIYENKR